MPDNIDLPERRLEISHVVSDINRLDAGPSYSVVRLAEEMAHNHDVTLHTLEPRPEGPPSVATSFYKRAPIARSIGISPAMRRGLREASRRSNVVHSHGLWMMPNVYPGRAARNGGAKLVVSPRGTLNPWALKWSSGRKKVFGSLLQYPALRRADCFHATSEMEAESIRAAGFTQPIAVIPIGIDIPTIPDVDAPDQRTLLYLGRIHPVKNVDGLIRAWMAVSDAYPDWRLVIAGPGDSDYRNGLESLAEGTRSIEFRGAVYGSEKARLLASSELFILPTHSENFGIVVAEALSNAVPVVSSRGAPWEGLVEEDCGWWTQSDDAALASTLEAAIGQDFASLRRMGSNGRSWMELDFAWPVVAESTIATYHWLTSGGEQPDFVHTS